MAKKKPIGRPPVDPQHKRRPVGIPLSADELHVIRAAAAAVGKPFTVFARDAILDAAARTRRKRGPSGLRQRDSG